jgi:hypothetical protein
MFYDFFEVCFTLLNYFSTNDPDPNPDPFKTCISFKHKFHPLSPELPLVIFQLDKSNCMFDLTPFKTIFTCNLTSQEGASK